MNQFTSFLCTLVLFLLVVPQTMGFELPASWNYQAVPLFSIGLTRGGEDILDGNDDSLGSQVSAGGLLSISSGIQFELPDMNLAVRGTVGIHADSLLSRISSYSFDRKNVELMVYSGWPRHRFGGGVTYHINPTLKSRLYVNATSFQEAQFEDSLGFVAEYLFQPWHNVNFSLRQVFIDYKTGGQIRPIIDGSHSGVGITYLF
ncbi:MAG TPA: hypothetical protein DCZ03_15675 [Gammaproteobacteria bacterium]|nr:hypothetical protein [Gammaproteobacteria bacterium]